tara:strand:- start:3051 stop:4175 length:1125 start_codon:yes stop_codon:yes gene_type:complete
MMENKRVDALLEGTSRSFFLSLRVLPKKIRRHIGLTYLLARLADTIADSKVGENEVLTQYLKEYNIRIQDPGKELPDFESLAAIQENKAEAELLSNAIIAVSYLDEDRELNQEDLERLALIANGGEGGANKVSIETIRNYNIAKSKRFTNSDRKKIRTCLDIIISGQTLDLERFADASESKIVSLENEDQLDDYTYRVAGSVGEFWTHMSLDHLFEMDSSNQEILFTKAVNFGKSLQLINILRDLPEDLQMGRCYLPRQTLNEYDLTPEDLLDSRNMGNFRPLFSSYLEKANYYLNNAVEYIQMLPKNQYRLRLSCMLPVLIGQRTLILLEEGNILDSNNRIKVMRREIKKIKRKSIWLCLTRRNPKKMIEIMN